MRRLFVFLLLHEDQLFRHWEYQIREQKFQGAVWIEEIGMGIRGEMGKGYTFPCLIQVLKL